MVRLFENGDVIAEYTASVNNHASVVCVTVHWEAAVVCVIVHWEAVVHKFLDEATDFGLYKGAPNFFQPLNNSRFSL